MSYSPPASARPYTLSISDQDISEWRQLLQLSKLGPETYEGRQKDRRFGITRDWLTEAKEYWLNTYDWRAQERRINSFANYKMQVEEIDLHFVALFSKKKNATPLLLLHGWPGSFMEFLPILTLVQEQCAGRDLPYHIIVPSLPGYTLSSGPPLHKDWTMLDSARILNLLMVHLGFDKYLVQGGDVGSFNARILSQHFDGCVGAHLNMMVVQDQPDESSLTPIEKKAVEYANNWRATGNAYAMEHSTRPSTIGHVLSASPLALLAWIGEKFLEWSDEDPSLDDILTNISLYWFTGGLPRSLYPYRQLFSPTALSGIGYLEKPLGFSFFPRELFPGIQSALAKNGNLVFYRQHESGGHFAALEKPEELWGDIEEFVKLAWKV